MALELFYVLFSIVLGLFPRYTMTLEITWEAGTNEKTNNGGIIGGVVGGLIIVIVGISIFIIYTMKMKGKQHSCPLW